MQGPRRPRLHALSTGRVAAVLLLATALAGCTSAPASTPSTAPSGGGQGGASASGSTGGAGAGPSGRQVLTEPTDVATGLSVPWGMVVLPGGDVLVSERETALVKRIGLDGQTREVGRVPGVAAAGEGGLLGITIDQRTYAATPTLYAYLTSADDNRVVAIPLSDGRFGDPRVVISGIPKSTNHNGGRIAFGPDGFLYVTTGDANRSDQSQDRNRLGGKILRVTPDGLPAEGNPFAGSPVWSYGHRNVQGIAWDRSGRMWASEFGQNTWDELNLITPGANYGWPTVEGQEARAGFVEPVRQWATSDASPSGIAIGPDGSVLMAALGGQSLWKIPVGADGSTGEPERLLEGQYGRIRDVVVGPDGNAWIVTNNTSRGSPRDGDDRVVRLPQSLTG